jgi:hypothetical protein
MGAGHKDIAFDRNFCLVQGTGSILVEYKGDFIGTVRGVDSVDLTHEYVYMLEELAQVGLTMNLVDSTDLGYERGFKELHDLEVEDFYLEEDGEHEF